MAVMVEVVIAAAAAAAVVVVVDTAGIADKQ